MTSSSSDRQVPARLEPSPPTGYGKPPAEHRFKKGVSGNPKGRPRKPAPVQAASLTSAMNIVLEEAYRLVTIRENNEEVRMPMIQAVTRSLGFAGIKGDRHAQLAFTSLVAAAEREVSAVEREVSNAKNVFYTQVMDYKQHWEREFRRYDREGQPRPEPVPHPHEMRLIPETGEVIFNGPIDEARAVGWAKLLETKEQALAEVERMEKNWRHAAAEREFVNHMIEQQQLIADAIAALLPDKSTRRAPDFDIRDWRRERQGRFFELARQVSERRMAMIGAQSKRKNRA